MGVATASRSGAGAGTGRGRPRAATRVSRAAPGITAMGSTSVGRTQELGAVIARASVRALLQNRLATALHDRAVESADRSRSSSGTASCKLSEPRRKLKIPPPDRWASMVPIRMPGVTRHELGPRRY